MFEQARLVRRALPAPLAGCCRNFERSEKGDHVIDLLWFQRKFRHLAAAALVRNDDPFGKSLRKIANVVALMQGPERWSGSIRTRPFETHCMAGGAVLVHELLSALNSRRGDYLIRGRRGRSLIRGVACRWHTCRI